MNACYAAGVETALPESGRGRAEADARSQPSVVGESVAWRVPATVDRADFVGAVMEDS